MIPFRRHRFAIITARVIGFAVIVLGCAGTASAQAEAGPPMYNGLTTGQWIERLSDEDKQVRRLAAYALGQMGPAAREAVRPLVEAADDQQLEVGWYALDALGRVGPAAKDAVPDIIRIVEKSGEYQTLQRNGIRALGRIGPDARDAVPLLKELLNSRNGQVRIDAALALWRIEPAEGVITTVAKDLENQRADIAFAAATALGELGPAAKPADRALIRALGHDDADVRRAAGRALSRIGIAALPLLVKALDFPDRFDRTTVLNTLGWIAADVRTGQLHRPETTADQYLAAATPLYQQVVPALLKLVTTADAETREAAADALARMGPMIVPPLLKLLEQQSSATARAGAILALQEMQRYLPADTSRLEGVERIKRGAVPSLTKALTHSDGEVRRAAFRLFDLLQIGPYGADAIPALRDGLRDEDVLIRRHAVRSLDRVQQDPGAE